MGQISQHKSVFFFSIILILCVGISIWVSHYIPKDYFDGVVTPILMVSTTTVALFSAVLMFKHSEGLRIRKVWGWALIAWGVADGLYIFSWMMAPLPVMNMGAYELSTHELVLGNMLGWVLLLYPAEVLRPGWMNWKRALWQLLPMFALVALDLLLPVKLDPLIALYPFALLGLLFNHVHAYQVWCEENFSTLSSARTPGRCCARPMTGRSMMPQRKRPCVIPRMPTVKSWRRGWSRRNPILIRASSSLTCRPSCPLIAPTFPSSSTQNTAAPSTSL